MQNDLDLGASGAIILGDRQLVITGGKQGPIYLAQASKLGGYDPTANNTNAYEVTACLSISVPLLSPLMLMRLALQSLNGHLITALLKSRCENLLCWDVNFETCQGSRSACKERTSAADDQPGTTELHELGCQHCVQRPCLLGRQWRPGLLPWPPHQPHRRHPVQATPPTHTPSPY